jgi:diguanylate cyclase (GGDEF)-like protein/PAS domain S-box-containing protein
MTDSIRARILAAAGMTIFLLGAAVCAGWLLRIERLIQPLPFFGLMVIGTAVCFILAGAATALCALDRPWSQVTRRWLAITVAVIAGLSLPANIFELAPDALTEAHRWLQPHARAPGQMAISTAFAFLCWSAGVLALPSAARSSMARRAIPVLTALVITLAIAGGVGRLMRFDLIFEHYPLVLMALHSAGGMIILGMALWLDCSRADWHARTNAAAEYHRITWISAMTLAIAVTIGGMLGYFMVSRQSQTFLNESLALTLQSRANAFEQALEERYFRAVMIATHPTIRTLLIRLRANPGEHQSREALAQIINSHLPFGFGGISLQDADGRVVIHAGQFIDSPPLSVQIRRGQATRLMWAADVLTLHHRIPVFSGDDHLGDVITEQPLLQLTGSLFDVHGLGTSAELQLCSLRDGYAHCFPNSRNSTPFSFPVGQSKQPGPMELALRGSSGISQLFDHKGVSVIAAHQNFAGRTLGMAIKINTADYYAEVRNHLLTSIIVILFAAGLGTLLIRALVSPLVSRISQSERALRLSEERLKLALEASHLALWDWDVAGGQIYLSAQWNALLGGEQRQSTATLQQLQDLIHPEDLPVLRQRLIEVLKANARTYDCDHRVRNHSGQWQWIRSRGKITDRDANGRALRMIGTNVDIDSRKQSEMELAHRATHDGLTGLPNRSLFHDRMSQAIARSRRNATLMAVMYLDIDKFKSINDTLGHAMGDALLKSFASRLTNCVRSTDTVARLGGDEFAVILGEIDEREDGCRIAGKIVAAMRPEFTLEYRPLAITTSVGIAFYDGSGEMTVDGLVKKADEALYQAKGAGRNNYQVAP